MNSVIEQPARAELQADPTTQLTPFHDDGRGDPLRGPGFGTVLLYRGHFGDASNFELIAWEARHGGR